MQDKPKTFYPTGTVNIPNDPLASGVIGEEDYKNMSAVYYYGNNKTLHTLADYIQSIQDQFPKPDPIEEQINIMDYQQTSKKQSIVDQIKQGVSLGQEHIEIDLMPNLFTSEEPHNSSFSHTDFNEIVNRTWCNIKNLTELKGGEYAGDVDRLANFRLISEQLGVPMETVWSVYASKHWAAVMQYAKDLKENKRRDRMEPIEGRCDDLIVYLMLFKAMIKERNSKGQI